MRSLRRGKRRNVSRNRTPGERRMAKFKRHFARYARRRSVR